MIDEKIDYIIFLAICHIIALLIFCTFIILIIIQLIRKKNINRAEKIGAIAITSIIFNQTLQQAILTPLQVLVTNVQKLFYLAYAHTDLHNNASTEEEVKLFLDANPLNEQVISVQQIFETFPLSKLFIAIAFAILIYFFIVYAKQSIAKKEQKSESVANKSVLIHNSIISIILLLSLFLVFSVCITIPYLNQVSKPTAFTAARLDSTLNEYSNKDTFEIVGLEDSPFFDSPGKLIFNDTVKQEFGNLSFSERQGINKSIGDFDQMYNIYKAERLNIINILNKFSENYKIRENFYKKILLVNYEKEIQSIIVDKGDLFQSSVQNFTDVVQFEKQGFDNTLQYVYSSDAYNISQKKKFVDQIKNSIFEFANDTKRDSSYYPYGGLYIVTPTFHPYHSYIYENFTEPFISAYVKDGSEWGIFGFVANYLIKTQSSELVLLMGMFGFGLLGASLFSFQQTNDNGNFINSFKTKPLILNFENVLARGFGAALVIYLATKGGLAIFSAGTATDANGYILLLTCFVGAVFSEKVWNKIRQTLYGNDK